MAGLVPTATEIFPATFDAAGMLAALYTHMNGTSTDFNVDDANTTTNTGDEGITLGPVATGQDFQINLRNNGGTIIEVSIEPTGLITDAGDSTPTAPTGTTADWSDEGTWDVTDTEVGSVAAGTKVWVIETDDHFTVLVSTSINTAYANGVHIGRIYQPIIQNADTIGQDGLGFLVGNPANPAVGGSTDWISGTNDSRLHYETDLWSVNVPGTLILTVSACPDGGDGENNVFAISHLAFADIGTNIDTICISSINRCTD